MRAAMIGFRGLKGLPILLLAGGLGLAIHGGAVAPAAETPERDARPPGQLSRDNYGSTRAYVDLRPNDLNFQQIEWHGSVYDGLAAGQREDKPLVLWLYFGDPRGGC
jgi:hypothetical protein